MSRTRISSSIVMKQMKDSVFFDSNILIYAHTDLDPEKRIISQQLISSDRLTYLSTQVLQEVSNTHSKKFKHPWDDIDNVIDQLATYNLLNINTGATVHQAIQIASRYGFSFYDSLIVASALECNCSILYTEDMQPGQVINGRLTIVNPFISG